MNNQNDMIIEKQLLKERDLIADNIQKTNNISIQEIEKLDKIYHTLKSQATWCAMKDAEEYSMMDMNDPNGMSGRKVHAPNSHNMSYEDGYNRGYSEAMNRSPNGSSGHYPMMPEYYGPRHW